MYETLSTSELNSCVRPFLFKSGAVLLGAQLALGCGGRPYFSLISLTSRGYIFGYFKVYAAVHTPAIAAPESAL